MNTLDMSLALSNLLILHQPCNPGSEHTLYTCHMVHLPTPLNTNSHCPEHFSLDSALWHTLRGSVFFIIHVMHTLCFLAENKAFNIFPSPLLSM